MKRLVWAAVLAVLTCAVCIAAAANRPRVAQDSIDDAPRAGVLASPAVQDSRSDGSSSPDPASDASEGAEDPPVPASLTPSPQPSSQYAEPAFSSGEAYEEPEEPVSDSAVLSRRALYSALGEIDACDTLTECPEGTYLRRTYDYPGGDRFSCARLSAPSALPTVALEKLRLDGAEGEARYYDGSQWVSFPLESAELGYGMYFISTNRQHMIICLPAAYVDRDGVLEYLPQCEGRLIIEKDGDGWSLNICCRHVVPSSDVEYMYLISDRRLIDWSLENAESDWSGFLFTGSSRWTCDGYYYNSPENYYPSVPNSFFRLPAAYITAKYVSTSDIYRASKLFALPMLDIMCSLQNGLGFFPTSAGSTWLLEEYGIGMGFYDTRFNADLILAMTGAIEQLDAQFLKPYVLRFADFFEAYADTKGILRGNGILLPDYWHPDGCRVTHTSLNHQCAEALMAFGLYGLTSRTRMYNIAVLLLRGIVAEADFWMSGPGGNLNYAWRDGEPYGTDYPYLTYDDMVKLQNAVKTYFGDPDPVLQELIDYKLYWMRANRVTGYMEQ